MRVTVSAEFDNIDIAEHVIRVLKGLGFNNAEIKVFSIPCGIDKKFQTRDGLILNGKFDCVSNNSSTYSYAAVSNNNSQVAALKSNGAKIYMSVDTSEDMRLKITGILVNHGGRYVERSDNQQ